MWHDHDRFSVLTDQLHDFISVKITYWVNLSYFYALMLLDRKNNILTKVGAFICYGA
jgi:hypothetical protein